MAGLVNTRALRECEQASQILGARGADRAHE